MQAVLLWEGGRRYPHLVSTHHRAQALCCVFPSTSNLAAKVAVRYVLHFTDKGTKAQKSIWFAQIQWWCWDLNPGQYDCMTHVISTPANWIIACVLAHMLFILCSHWSRWPWFPLKKTRKVCLFIFSLMLCVIKDDRNVHIVHSYPLGLQNTDHFLWHNISPATPNL